MTASSLKRHLEHFLSAGVRLYEQTGADALLLLVDRKLDWDVVREATEGIPVLVAADDEEDLAGVAARELKTVLLDVAGLPRRSSRRRYWNVWLQS